MNTEYLVHSVGCAHLLTVLWCFESSHALLKLTEGWIDCVTRDLWKCLKKVYSTCDYLPFASHFPLERIFSNLIFLFPCIPHWHTFPQNWKCPKVVSPKYLLSMLSQCWWWISHGSSLLCRFAGDRGQEEKQGEERCPLVLFFVWTLLFSVFSAQGNILGGGD